MSARTALTVLWAILLIVPMTMRGSSQRVVAKSALSGSISVYQFTEGTAIDHTFQAMAKTFEQEYPGTQVNLTILPYSQYATKVALLEASNSAPDIFWATGDVLRFVSEGKIIPLDNYILKDPILGSRTKTRFWANAMTMFDGKHIWAAQNGALCSMQLYYNRDLFDKAHVAYPTNDWTWDDFLAAAKKLTIHQGGDTVQWGADWGYLPGWDGGWESMAASNGAKKIFDRVFDPRQMNLNQPGVIKAWQFMQDLVYKYKVAPTPAISSALSQQGASDFQSGKIAMVTDGCWQLPAYKQAIKHLGMALLPKGTAGRTQPVWYAGELVISAASKNKDLAWAWARWLAVDPKANAMAAGNGQNCGAPIVKAFDSLYSAVWKGIPGGAACVTSLQNAKFFGWSSPQGDEINNTIITPEWDKFKTDKITAAQMAADLDKSINAALKTGHS